MLLRLSLILKCICLMLCLSFNEWRGIDPGEQMILAPFLGKPSLDRAAGRFADFLFALKHAKADVLLTTILGPLRGVAVNTCCCSCIPARTNYYLAIPVADCNFRCLLILLQCEKEKQRRQQQPPPMSETKGWGAPIRSREDLVLFLFEWAKNRTTTRGESSRTTVRNGHARGRQDRCGRVLRQLECGLFFLRERLCTVQGPNSCIFRKQFS